MKDVLEVLQFRDRQNLRLSRVPASLARVRRSDRVKRGADGVDQIELEFGGHHRRQAQPGKAPEDIGQHLARVAIEAAAVRVAHGKQDLRGGAVEPCDARQRARHRKAEPVRIAGAFRQPGSVDVASPDVERIDRAWHRHAVRQDVESPFARDPFAPRHAVHVDDEGLEDLDVGIAVEEDLS